MSQAPQIKIPATYMRGGTSKGVFFRLEDLPHAAQVPGKARDRLFQRVIGSPDPYAAQIDGMGGATSCPRALVPVMTWITSTVRSPSTRISSTGAATAATCPQARGPSLFMPDILMPHVLRRMVSVPCASGRPTSARRLLLMCRSLTGRYRRPVISNWMA